MVSLFLEKGANIEAKDKTGLTALLLSCLNGHKEIVSLLLEKGANIEAKDNNRMTALHVACSNGHKEIVSLLLEKGANIEAKDKDGNTPLTVSCDRRFEEIVLLLLKQNAIFEPEIKHGLFSSMLTKPRKSALRVACESKVVNENFPQRLGVVFLLLSRGADPSELLKEKSSLDQEIVRALELFKHKNKNSALLLSCELWGGNVYELHISRGANARAANQDGYSPLLIAIAHGNILLLNHLFSKFEPPFRFGVENILLFAKNKGRPESRAWLWNHIVQDVKYIDLSQSLLIDPSLYSLLDQYERPISALALPMIKEAMDKVLLWFGRYRLLEQRPEHQSTTCFVFKAEDQRLRDESGAKRKVALKLMFRRDHFLKEVEMRSQFGFEDAHVISVLAQHPSEPSDILSKNSEIFLDLFVDGVPNKMKAENMFAISLPLADRNLFVALKQERFAGKDWNMVKFILKNLVEAVAHVHSKDIIHADLKPLNIVRVNENWKLIDFDACCHIGVDHTGLKSSSAFCPPESIYVDHSMFPAIACVRSKEHKNATRTNYDLLLAHPSFDVWGLGCICYMLCTDCRMLFQGGQDDNLQMADSFDSLFHLEEWSDVLKTEKLSRVKDPLARNLLSQILMKDPVKRPSLSRILDHPFLSGKQVARIVGDDAEFDLFFSYRVSSDLPHVEYLYDKLTAEGLTVWWDKKELKPGENWEQAFINGLVKSRNFVPFLSQDGLAKFSTLGPSSQCDNLFLEHRFALELQEMCLIEQIFPIVLGNVVAGSQPIQMKIDWSAIFPVCPDVCVSEVEERTCHYLQTQALGTPFKPSRTVHSVMTEMKKMQGALIDGDYELKMMEATETILKLKQSEGKSRSSEPTDELSILKSFLEKQTPEKRTQFLESINNMIQSSV